MQNKPKQNQGWLVILLGGGVIFALASVCIMVGLIWRSSRPKTESIVAVTPVMAILTAMDTATPMAESPTDIPTAVPTLSPTPKPVSGDSLSLPTGTLTPRPTATVTPPPTATAIPGQSEGLAVGNIAPDFTVGNTRDSRISLSDLRGKVVVLNFWATWCPPCRSEVPALQAVHNEYGPQGVVVLAVNVKEKIETVSRYAWDNGISFNVWLDEDGWVSTIYGVRSIPITYFIDAQGIIRAVHFGAMNREQITVQVQKLL